jgi:hypothetical protein
MSGHTFISRPLKFQGYTALPTRQEDQSRISLFLPGHSQAQSAVVEVGREGDPAEKVQQFRLERSPDGHYWRVRPQDEQNDAFVVTNRYDADAGEGLRYRFLVADENGKLKPVQDALATTSSVPGFTQIMPIAAVNVDPKSGPMLDIFNDSVVAMFNARKLEDRTKTPDVFGERNHFNNFSRDLGKLTAWEDRKTLEHKYLNELLPWAVEEMGFTSFLWKPFIGADNIGSHGYWTTDGAQLNKTFGDKQVFKKVLDKSLGYGLDIYADAAFVNQGYNGIQVWSNLAYGKQSPFWQYFKYDEQPNVPGIFRLPDHAHAQKQSVGILPVITDPSLGNQRVINPKAFAIRVLNAPGSQDFDDKKPTFIETFDPRLENPDGTPKSKEQLKDVPPILYSYDSVVRLRFPVDAKEAQKKLGELKSLGAARENVAGPYGDNVAILQLPAHASGNPADAQTRAYLETVQEWDRLKLTTFNGDNSGYKWDGQLDVTKVDINNPNVENTIGQTMSYWTRFVRNRYIHQIGLGLQQAAGVQPIAENNIVQLVRDIATDSRTQEKNFRTEGKVFYSRFHNYANPKDQEHLLNIRHWLRDKYKEDTEFASASSDNRAQMLAARMVREYGIANVPLMDDNYPALFKSVLTNPELQRHLGWTDEVPADTPLEKISTPIAKVLSAPLRVVGITVLSPFEKVLSGKLKEAVSGLPQLHQEALNAPLVQSVVMNEFGEDLYIKLLTGKWPQEHQKDERGNLRDPQDYNKAVLNGLYSHMDPSILKADPIAGARMLRGFLKGELKKLDKEEIQQHLRMHLEEGGKVLTADAAEWSFAILQKEKLGMHWRLDASKDFLPMDDIRANPNHKQRSEMFHGNGVENLLYPLWERLLNLGGDAKGAKVKPYEGVREIFPKSNIIGELTDALWQDRTQGLRKLMTLFNGLPNYDFFIWAANRSLNGADQWGVGGGARAGLKYGLYSMAQTTPEMGSMSNISSNHDQPTTTYLGLLNPQLAYMDTMVNFVGPGEFRGNEIARLENLLPNSLYELRDKGTFQAERRLLADIGVKPESLSQTIAQFEAPKFMESGYYRKLAQAAPQVKTYFDQLNGETWDIPRDVRLKVVEGMIAPGNGLNPVQTLSEKDRQKVNALLEALFARHIGTSPTSPTQVPERSVTEMAKRPEMLQKLLTGSISAQQIDPANAKLDQALKAMAQGVDDPEAVRKTFILGAVLGDRVLEFSEVRAMRAVVNNLLEDPKVSKGFAPVLPGGAKSLESFKAAVYAGYNEAASQYGRHLGFQPLNTVLERTLDAAKATPQGKAIGLDQLNEAGQNQIVDAMYEVAMKPVLEKMRRMVALQVACPGVPTVYMADILGQVGGETLKNKFVQDRPVFNLQWLKENFLDPMGNRIQSDTFKPYLRDYAQSLASTLRLRQLYPSLDNGSMIKPPELARIDALEAARDQAGSPDERSRLEAEIKERAQAFEDKGVLPFIRDNGQEQTLMLVNTGKPNKPFAQRTTQGADGTPKTEDRYWNRVGEAGPLYHSIQADALVKDYTMDLQGLGIAPGTPYALIDPKTGKASKVFTVDKNGNLPLKGVTFSDYAVLVRQPQKAPLQANA